MRSRRKRRLIDRCIAITSLIALPALLGARWWWWWLVHQVVVSMRIKVLWEAVIISKSFYRLPKLKAPTRRFIIHLGNAMDFLFPPNQTIRFPFPHLPVPPSPILSTNSLLDIPLQICWFVPVTTFWLIYPRLPFSLRTVLQWLTRNYTLRVSLVRKGEKDSRLTDWLAFSGRSNVSRSSPFIHCIALIIPEEASKLKHIIDSRVWWTDTRRQTVGERS